MSGSSILLIEDDLNVYHGVQRKLKSAGYETFYAPDAIASVSQARQHHPDLILLDLGLPAGDGFVVIDRLRGLAELSVIPIVVLSGRDRGANEMRAMRAGAAAYLQKPVSGELLLETIAKHMGKAQPIKTHNTYSVGATMASSQLRTVTGNASDDDVPVYEWQEYAQVR
jgi:DNA-binding response OmpR family regulator